MTEPIKETPGESPHLPDGENLRAEYSALSSYFNTVVSFRFTTLGFFLAALALIVASEVTRGKALLLLVITIALYIIELRNRTLYINLSSRGMQIERKYWGYRGGRAYEPFFSHMFKTRPTDDENAPEPPPLDYPRWHNGRFELGVAPSHNQGLDLLYFGVGAYAFIAFLVA